jgi:membrane protein DedA with SNARE-associated domain
MQHKLPRYTLPADDQRNQHESGQGMSDINLLSELTTSVTIYGPATVAVVLLLAALGTPLPSSLLVVATGALARQGMIDGASAAALGLLGAVVGDLAGYTLGRMAGQRVQRLQARSHLWERARTTFVQAGGPAVYLTRWAITPIALPVNLLAGSSGYSFWRFVGFDAAGELTWIVLYGGLGYVLGSQWEWVNEQAGVLGAGLAGAVALCALVYALIRYMRPDLTLARVPVGR